ncbi:hypothetical protein PsorP6_003992 [Peronosclerospora sorghi]|uniref:Uncharacterized protein n=1 Tax=Peronosclerospora sorghi TaxID=230839 RepID=A0ACC0VM94_9STRA|nr:hypothetical protein PsorP6_003992 [Peronosclerospora sorghi]
MTGDTLFNCFLLNSQQVDNLEAFPVGAVYFSEQTLGEPIVVAPHSAAVNRAAKFRDTYFIAYNRRVCAIGTSISLANCDVNGKDCIVVDTLVGAGATLLKTAKVLKAISAKTVSAFAVHARYSDDVSLVPSSVIVDLQTLENCKDLDKLVTTNTIPMHFKANEQSSKIVTFHFLHSYQELHHLSLEDQVTSLMQKNWLKYISSNRTKKNCFNHVPLGKTSCANRLSLQIRE